jgi:hypothetical protein
MSTVADGDVLAKIESSNRFLIQQLFKPIANEYRISIPAPGSTEEGEPVLFVKQKKLKIKEDIRFRASPDDDAVRTVYARDCSLATIADRHLSVLLGCLNNRVERDGLPQHNIVSRRS